MKEIIVDKSALVDQTLEKSQHKYSEHNTAKYDLDRENQLKEIQDYAKKHNIKVTIKDTGKDVHTHRASESRRVKSPEQLRNEAKSKKAEEAQPAESKNSITGDQDEEVSKETPDALSKMISQAEPGWSPEDEITNKHLYDIVRAQREAGNSSKLMTPTQLHRDLEAAGYKLQPLGKYGTKLRPKKSAAH